MSFALGKFSPKFGVPRQCDVVAFRQMKSPLQLHALLCSGNEPDGIRNLQNSEHVDVVNTRRSVMLQSDKQMWMDSVERTLSCIN